MTLQEKITRDMKEAMREKDKIRLAALRAVKSALLLMATDSQKKKIEPADELKMLQKQVKQRKDSAEIYTKQNRDDLAEIELKEAEVIESYLPDKLSPEEIEAEVKKIVDEVNASGMQDMGKVMGVANKKLAGRAEGKDIADKVKQVLS
ncbi:MAG: GatB/YqeY domain-containing protein [Bacteroidota bacterium]|nr:GatB/YqeY domain-containing protein [Bacteroidota bacterium]